MDLTLVVPAAGRGTRLWPRTANTPKPMISVGGRPILEYVLKFGRQVGVERIALVIAPEGHAIQEYFGRSYRGIPIYYVMQPDPRGLANAVALAEPYVRDMMLVINGDELFLHSRHNRLRCVLEDARADGLVGFVRTDNPARISTGYGLDVGDEMRITRLVEKPDKPWNDLLGVGTWLLGREYFDQFEATPTHPTRSERDFVAVVQRLIDHGYKIVATDLGCIFFNINTEEDRLRAERFLDQNSTRRIFENGPLSLRESRS
jgi:NDP-sugar pyrophosphorylase family protein